MAIRSLYPQKRKMDKYDEDEKSKYEDEEDSDNENSDDECDEDDSDDDSYEDSDKDEDEEDSDDGDEGGKRKILMMRTPLIVKSSKMLFFVKQSPVNLIQPICAPEYGLLTVKVGNAWKYQKKYSQHLAIQTK